ncbi:hypothetical protein HID58_072733 [Brassica napus]|uniref:(rape) hypothetical protein n=1 Tax=Brassica napus TaxID=3708 RepID=A0A816QN52_BRANA|nr:hypothetical protein HID58_072733 [Brassica napus]CAF2063254.1 unnamed protein product [Brassica napus]
MESRTTEKESLKRLAFQVSKRVEKPHDKNQTYQELILDSLSLYTNIREREIRMEKQEFLELFEAATKAAKSAVIGDGKSSSPAVSRSLLNCGSSLIQWFDQVFINTSTRKNLGFKSQKT